MTPSHPTSPLVVRAVEAPTTSLSPQSRTSFPFAGASGHPEVFIDHASRGDGAPLHRHPWPTWEVVIAGRVRFVVGDVTHELAAGDAIYTPPDVPHTYVVESDQAIMCGLNGPGSRFFDLQRRAGPLFQAEGGPDMRAIVALAAEHHVQVLGPPLAPALARDPA